MFLLDGIATLISRPTWSRRRLGCLALAQPGSAVVNPRATDLLSVCLSRPGGLCTCPFGAGTISPGIFRCHTRMNGEGGMADKYPTIWDLQPHTAAKHAILRRYLQAWFPKLTAFNSRVVFIDGFAGPGRYTGGEPGSPMVAMETAIQHSHDLSKKELVFLFIEEDEERYLHLVEEIQKLQPPAYIKVQHAHGTFDDTLKQVVEALGDSHMAPALILVDPFGVKGLPFVTLEKLAGYPKSEFLISFMYESMNRFLTTPEFEPHLDEMFEVTGWREAVGIPDKVARHRFLVELYSSRLGDIGMDYRRTFEMRDAGDRVEYDLVFASHSIEGLKAMKDAMWKVDPSGSYRFSDATNPNQLTLFAHEPDIQQLKDRILERFGGRQASVELVERFVVAETAFRETHYKQQVLKPMEESGQLHVVSSKRKRRFAYPSGTVLRFG